MYTYVPSYTCSISKLYPFAGKPANWKCNMYPYLHFEIKTWNFFRLIDLQYRRPSSFLSGKPVIRHFSRRNNLSIHFSSPRHTPETLRIYMPHVLHTISSSLNRRLSGFRLYFASALQKKKEAFSFLYFIYNPFYNDFAKTRKKKKNFKKLFQLIAVIKVYFGTQRKAIY